MSQVVPRETSDEPHYWVMASIIEPKYEAERIFLQAEIAYVLRKLGESRHGVWAKLSLPSLAFYGRKDWQKYAHALEKYSRGLDEYSDEVKNGILPVKFAIYNSASSRDTRVRVMIKVKNGRIDLAKKPPERPRRLDAPSKAWPKLTLPKIGGFVRTGVKITPHQISVGLSTLEARDGAALITKLVHLHRGPQTQITYTISSTKVDHETGAVEF